MSYRCSICGETHDDLPDITSDKPDHWWNVPAEERDKRILLTTDWCVIDNHDFFIRGVVEIPIHDYHRPFGFGVWVSQKQENFVTYMKNFESDEIGPFFGWLCTRISYYERETVLLKTQVCFRPGGLRPLVEVEPTDHPLAMDQKNGITLAKAWEIVHHYIPKTSTSKAD